MQAKPMKVLQLIHNLRAEGAQRVVVNLVTATSLVTTTESSPIQQLVCAWKSGGPLAQHLLALSERENKQSLSLILGDQDPLQHKSFFIRLLYLHKIVRQQQIDLVHAHLSDAAIIAALINWSIGIPFVITHHCPNAMPPNIRGIKARLYARLIHWALRRASVHIAISPAVQDKVASDFRLQRAQWRMIPNGVPLPITSDPAHLPLGFPPEFINKPLVIAVGRLDAVKDVAQLITIMPQVLLVMPHLRLAIVGEGPLRSQLQAQIQALQLEKSVILAGLSTEVDAWLHRASVLVSCSCYEGVPMALLEAMNCGLPVVASDVTGNRDVITHGRTGWLYEKNCPDHLVSTLLKVLDDRTHALQIATAATLWVREHYSQQSMASSYQQLYKSLLA